MINPLLEPLDKFGSFVNDIKITDETRPKPDRLRISLVFKNERLREYATENLETHLVDARKDLMVHQFLSSVIEECQLPPLRSGTKFLIMFKGQSSKFNINFERTDLLCTVYKRIRAIEINRQSLLKKNYSNEDLQVPQNQRNSILEQEGLHLNSEPIIAEIDMINTHLN